MFDPVSTRHGLGNRVWLFKWAVSSVALLTFGIVSAAFLKLSPFLDQHALIAAGVAVISSGGMWGAYRHAKTCLDDYCTAQQSITAALKAQSSEEIVGLRLQLDEAAKRDTSIQGLQAHSKANLDRHLSDVMEDETRKARSLRVAVLCADARRMLSGRIEQNRLASPVIKAEQQISEAITNLKRHKSDAERQLDEQRQRSFLKAWLDFTRPTFEEVDAKIAELEAAHQRLVNSGKIAKTDRYYAELGALVKRRTVDIERAALSAIPDRREDNFDDTRIVQSALIFSAISLPVSAWQDVSQAGSVYDSLREVNGNYTGINDADIWLDTLMMPSEQLAGLANLTKGALFEKYVEADFEGQRFEYFNHPDTDIVIDGVAIQIKATDSISYVNSVAEGIPVISTSEVANATGSIDSGYANEDLTNAVDLAFGGTILDISDTAVDAVLSGVGGVGIFAIFRGIQSASARYKESGDAIESLEAFIGATATTTIRTVVNTGELAFRGAVGVLNSGPARFLGRMLAAGVSAGVKKIDDSLEKAEEEASKAKKLSAVRPRTDGSKIG